MTATSIEWTDKTWNPVTGCTKVSPGCAHCYAETVADRFWPSQYPEVVSANCPDGRPRLFTDVDWHEERLDQPLRWKKPARIFVNSMSDLFHEDVPDDFIARVFSVMAWARWHTFQVLTKRHERMQALLSSAKFLAEVEEFVDFWLHDDPVDLPALRWDPHNRRTDDAMANVPDINTWPLPNIWMGVSVENQKFADERIPLLLQTPAAVRFISAEPLLGPVDLNALPDPKGDPSWDASALHGVRECPFGATVSREQINKLDWVIVGGESGPKARPFEPSWARSIVQQCKAAGVPVFVKQFGGHVITRNDDGWEGDTPKSWPMDTAFDEDLTGYRDGYQGAPVRVRLVSKKGGDPSEWPEDLRVREFPR